MSERIRNFTKLALVGAVAIEASRWALTSPARRECLQRDKYQCQGINGEKCYLETVTGKPTRFQDGYMIEASHFPETQHLSGKGYHDDNPDNAEAQCKICHALQHYDQGQIGTAKLILSGGLYKTKFLPHQTPIEQIIPTLQECLNVRSEAREITKSDIIYQVKV